MKIKLVHNFEDIAGIENLLMAWTEFVKGKKSKPDIQQFKLNLMDNIFALHSDLINHTYNHGGYQAFKVYDPKPRNIHKASVRDRLVHHAVYRVLYPFFDKTFIDGSFSCRNKKGTYKALEKFQRYFYKVSQNNTRTCYCLKMDIRKFFANIDHKILLKILRQYIEDDETIWLLENIINSFHSNERGIGLPLGNLTSQLFVNVYMNRFDQFVKHKLKEDFYIRYADDFVILSHSYQRLVEIVSPISGFLKEKLQLDIHPRKIFIKTFASGVDFLGWVHFHDHRILRTTTKKRLFRNLSQNPRQEVLQSYIGLLKHGNTYKINQGLN